MQQTCLGSIAIIVIAVNLARIVAASCFVDSVRNIGVGYKLNAVALAQDGMRGHLQLGVRAKAVIEDQRRNVDLRAKKITRPG